MTHPHHQYRRHKVFTTAAAVFTCLTLGLAGCSNNTEPDPIPETAPTESPTSATPTESPTSETPNWEDDFTANELVLYEASLARWKEYTSKTDAIYKRGKDTPKARAVFQEYSMTWQNRVRELAATYDAGGVRIPVPAKPLSWRPISVKPTVVVIGQCTDYSQIVVTQKGKKVKGTKPDHLKTELVIEMDKIEGRGWMVANTELKDKKSCVE